MLYFGGQERVYDISHYGVSRPRDHLSGNYGSPPQVMRMNCSYNCCPGLVAFNTVLPFNCYRAISMDMEKGNLVMEV